MTAIHLVDFEISREKGGSQKNTIGHLGVNGGSNKRELSHENGHYHSVSTNLSHWNSVGCIMHTDHIKASFFEIKIKLMLLSL